MKHTKRTAKVKAALIVAQGEGWRVEFDRESRDYCAIIDGPVGCIGYTAEPLAAQTRCREYMAQQLAPAPVAA